MSDIQQRKEILTLVKELAYYFEKAKDDLCSPYGLSTIQSTILIDVFNNEGTRVTGICKRLHKSTNTISPLINRLESHGFLVKKVGVHDKRVANVYLTEKAHKIMIDLSNEINKFTWPMFDQLSDEETKEVINSLRLLKKVTEGC